MESELVDIVQRMGRVRALVVGDVMLDRYVWGDAERISQERRSSCSARIGARSGWEGPAASPSCWGHWAPGSRSPPQSAPTPTGIG